MYCCRVGSAAAVLCSVGLGQVSAAADDTELLLVVSSAGCHLSLRHRLLSPHLALVCCEGRLCWCVSGSRVHVR